MYVTDQCKGCYAFTGPSLVHQPLYMQQLHHFAVRNHWLPSIRIEAMLESWASRALAPQIDILMMCDTVRWYGNPCLLRT